jgi:ATP diphosphatase
VNVKLSKEKQVFDGKDNDKNKKDKLQKLLNVMETMRNGDPSCAWTKAQTWHSLVRHTIEEAYEVAYSIEQNSTDDVKAELADLLNQVIFYAQIAKEEGLFDFYDVIECLTEKLIKRHPNVFLNDHENDIELLEKKWEEIKKNERKEKGLISILDDIVPNLPALSIANKLQVRASSVGFDWSEKEDVFKQLKSEVLELEEALVQDNHDEILKETGDILFACVNLIRHLKADPEQVMRQANDKFQRRFRFIEESLKNNHQSLKETSIDEMEKLWQKAKEIEQKTD